MLVVLGGIWLVGVWVVWMIGPSNWRTSPREHWQHALLWPIRWFKS
jgi:hypothetical protein